MSEQQPAKRPLRDLWDRARVWLAMALLLGAAAVAILAMLTHHSTICAHTPRWTTC